MPSYKLPEPKKPKKTESVPVDDYDDWEWRRKIHAIPANKEILEAIEAGEEATIVLKGIITGTRNEDRVKGQARMEFDFEVAEVMVDYEETNVYSKLAEDE